MFIDIVVVKRSGVNYLYRAPAWSNIEKGDEVIVGTNLCQDEGVVVAKETTSEESPLMHFFLAAFGATLPLECVLAVKKTEEIVYPPEKVEAEND